MARKPKPARFHQLYNTECDMIIAALRLWQHVVKRDPIKIPAEIYEIASERKGEPLSLEWIDSLCEELNYPLPIEWSDECPACHSNEVTGYSVEIADDMATQRCSCDECGAEWVTAYGLFSVERL